MIALADSTRMTLRSYSQDCVLGEKLYEDSAMT